MEMSVMIVQGKILRIKLLLSCVLILVAGCVPESIDQGVSLNDVHSRLIPTTVAQYYEPQSAREIAAIVKRAKRLGNAVSISGGRHAMGGQQFGEGTTHINLSQFNEVLSLDEKRGLITVESGIQWPVLMQWLLTEQEGREKQWGIRQKQTGADSLSIGGALSANAHGRGLTLKPMIGDVESFNLVDADGIVRECSRDNNRELFGLAIGGYGLFGVITEVTLRLSPRQSLVRDVEMITVDEVPEKVEERIREGYIYGDYQFMTDEASPDFLSRGVFSFYKPTNKVVPDRQSQKKLSKENWIQLYQLAHVNKSKAFDLYSQFYLSTDGQIYWSDTHQLSTYLQGYDGVVDQMLKSRAPGSLMICEYYVPRSRLPDFFKRMGAALIETKANLIYGTVRYIEEDNESYLAWAKQSYACTVINLRVVHDEKGIEEAKKQFRTITDIALDMDGSYFLTYHRWATKDQVLKAYPQFPQFIQKKLQFDPEERFQSEWYRHYRAMFEGSE